jgi:Na+-driven multidrug efflux pump
MTPPSNDLQRLLTAPILPTLLRLSAPNVLAMVMTVLVGIAETYYVGRLGTAPLAAMALVFPFAMLTQMMSAGAMGGGCQRLSAGPWAPPTCRVRKPCCSMPC